MGRTQVRQAFTTVRFRLDLDISRPGKRGLSETDPYMMLAEEGGNNVQALIPTEKWLPLRAVAATTRWAILVGRFAVLLHTFVRFEPLAGKEQQLRDELKLLLEPTRAEPGCIRIHLYEAVREPLLFYIHSEWVDEAAFDAHPKLPHMVRFLALVGGLTTHPVKGIRTKQIG